MGFPSRRREGPSGASELLTLRYAQESDSNSGALRITPCRLIGQGGNAAARLHSLVSYGSELSCILTDHAADVFTLAGL